jgi:hypothetical protein
MTGRDSQRKLHVSSRASAGNSGVVPVRFVALVGALAIAACAASTHIVRVVPDGASTGGTSTALSDPTFEVITQLASARDPLPVVGGDAEYADLERSLAQAVVHAVAPRHDSVLVVELVRADALYDHGRLSVALVVRGTLRTRLGEFIAQTQAVCRDGAIITPAEGSRVMWSCMTRIGKDLAGWLDGLPPPTREERS